MKPSVKFSKGDYSSNCGESLSVKIIVVSSDTNGTIYLKLAADSCKFENDDVKSNYFANEKEVEFNVIIHCNKKGDFNSRLITWAENEDGKSLEVEQTITIYCK